MYRKCDTLTLLTTNDAFWRCQILATCYQLAQSVLKIGSVLAEKVGQWEVGGCTASVAAAYRKALVNGSHLSAFLHKQA